MTHIHNGNGHGCELQQEQCLPTNLNKKSGSTDIWSPWGIANCLTLPLDINVINNIHNNNNNNNNN